MKYSLQQKLDREQSNCHSVQQEMETLRNQMEEEHKWKAQRVEEVCAKRVHDATSLNEDLKMEVQKLEVQVSVIVHRQSYMDCVYVYVCVCVCVCVCVSQTDKIMILWVGCRLRTIKKS